MTKVLAPDDFAKRIRANLAKDLYLPARELAAQAIGGIVKGEADSSTDEEFEWLRHAPEWNAAPDAQCVPRRAF